ncbi:hypothetical protein [Pseudomonas sp. A-R-19]|uniref:hypothetical protein n=1 Tax=Pseudomonas sp. A-R-19 TaxID=2832403 RepID=UPI001CC13F4B|nr:hypothetical protein [Pseudomonas sp. A-R-19]
MTDTLADLVRQQLAHIRAQLSGAEAALARIRAHGDPRHAEVEAKTRQQIEALSAKAESLTQQLEDASDRVLH